LVVELDGLEATEEYCPGYELDELDGLEANEEYCAEIGLDLTTVDINFGGLIVAQ
jgi:hypothetical protein